MFLQRSCCGETGQNSHNSATIPEAFNFMNKKSLHFEIEMYTFAEAEYFLYSYQEHKGRSKITIRQNVKKAFYIKRTYKASQIIPVKSG